MKKNLLFGIVTYLCLALPAQAQLQKNTKYWGGTVNFVGSHNTFEDSDGSNQFSINPAIQAGKFVKDNQLVGIGLGTSLNFQWNGNSYGPSTSKRGSHQNAYTLSPFVRHYKSLNAKWAIFLNSSLSLSYLGYYNSNSEPKRESGYSAGIRIVPGITYWLSSRFALESDVNLLSLGAEYTDFRDAKVVNFNSAVTTGITSYFSIRASWYLQKSLTN